MKKGKEKYEISSILYSSYVTKKLKVRKYSLTKQYYVSNFRICSEEVKAISYFGFKMCSEFFFAIKFWSGIGQKYGLVITSFERSWPPDFVITGNQPYCL